MEAVQKTREEHCWLRQQAYKGSTISPYVSPQCQMNPGASVRPSQAEGLRTCPMVPLRMRPLDRLAKEEAPYSALSPLVGVSRKWAETTDSGSAS